jgi:hypothetical protein
MLALAPWISIEPIFVVVWLAVSVGLIALSHVLVPFSSRLRQLHATPIIEPSHVSSVETSNQPPEQKDQSAI